MSLILPPRLQALLSMILVLSVSALAAKLSWQILAQWQTKAPLPQVFHAAVPPKDPLFSNLSLFKKPTAKQRSERLQPTTLAVSVKGLLLHEDPSRSQVVLIVEGQQRVVMSGDKLPLAGKVIVSGINSEKLLLNNNGKKEYLALGSLLTKGSEAAEASDSLEIKLAQTVFASSAAQFKSQLQRDPLSLARFIKLAPKALKDGERGYTLSPGADRRLYQALALKPDDVLLSLNDIPVSKPAKLLALTAVLEKDEPLKLGMLRNGQPLTFLLYL